MKFDDPMKEDSIEEKRDENYFDGIEHTSFMKKRPGFKPSSAAGMPVLLYLIGGVVIVILIGMIVLRSGKSFDPERMTGMDARIKQMEDRIIDLGLLEKKLDSIETQGQKLDQLTKRVNTLESNLSAILERTATQSREPKKPIAKSVQKSGGAVPKKTVAEKKQSSSKGSDVYHHVRSGDTLYSISRRYKLSVPELKQLNPSISGKKTIYPGQKLRIKKKQ